MASIETKEEMETATKTNNFYDILELFDHLEELDELASLNKDLIAAEESIARVLEEREWDL